MKQKATFSSKLGMIAATVGSAIGLGNIWRFPAEAQNNGGAAFLLIYIACMVLLGIPVMLAEFSLGRAGRSDSVGNFKNLTPGSKWWVAGSVGLIASYMILAFYVVVTGWIACYLWESLCGDLYQGYSALSDATFFKNKETDIITRGWEPVLWSAAVIVINIIVLIHGVKKGIEKLSNVLMPVLFILLLVLCAVSLTLPNASEGLKFFLHPDFSKVDISVVLNALGQAFFSLSLGMGILVTYSAYFPQGTRLARTSATVASLDFLVAFLAGLIIFPAVKSFALDTSAGGLEGTTLVFVTLPQIFARMPMSQVWSVLFFILLFVAALTSSISIAEVSVAFVCDRFNVARRKACYIVLIPVFITSAICALSMQDYDCLQWGSHNVFDWLDTIATNTLLPVSALLICLYVGWRLPRNFIKDQLTNHGEFSSHIVRPIEILVRFVCPILIASILIINVTGLPK